MKNLPYGKILEQIQEIACRVGRDAQEILLLAVTKYVSEEEISALYEAGCRDFGENRVPVLERKGRSFQEAGKEDLRWHFIGPLQRNKVRKGLAWATWIHSGESLELLQTIDRIAAEEGILPHVLIEVNLGGESQKHGFSPETLRQSWEEIQALKQIRLEGLMGMTSLDATEKEAHEQFAKLRKLRDEFLPGKHLSMGMSDDFPIAIEEGATILRIGSALFPHLKSSR